MPSSDALPEALAAALGGDVRVTGARPLGGSGGGAALAVLLDDGTGVVLERGAPRLGVR